MLKGLTFLVTALVGFSNSAAAKIVAEQMGAKAMRSPSQAGASGQYLIVANRKVVPLKHKSGNKMVLGYWGEATYSNSVRIDPRRKVFCVMGGIAPSDS